MINNNLRDILNVLSKVTPKRALNAAKVFSSFQYAKRSGIVSHKGLPISIAIEPTTSCNLRCPECPSGLRSFTRPAGMLKSETFKKIIDELHESLLYLTFYFQGEPYLHPKFLELVKYAANHKIYTATSTNGHYLTKEKALETVRSGLDRLIISLDGTTQETYENYRIGGKIEKVLEGAKHLLEARKELKSRTPYVVFQFLVVKPNEHQIEDVKKLAKQMGVDNVVFKTAQIYDYEHGNDLIPTIDRYSRYKESSPGLYTIKNGLQDECWKMWQSCVITWDGKVVPCCFDKDAHYALGELERESFTELWHSQLYNDFREKVMTSRSQIEMCKNCTEGAKVFA